MERLTIPDMHIDGGTQRAVAVIDTREVKKHAMTLYWRLKEYEDTELTPKQLTEIDRAYTERCRELEEYKLQLGRYKNLEEQGLLLKLPCKVGDEFWVIAYSEITHVKCTGYCIQKDISNNIEDSYVWLDSLKNPRDYWKLSFEDFKTQCFSSKVEAEEALRRMEREE